MNEEDNGNTFIDLNLCEVVRYLANLTNIRF